MTYACRLSEVREWVMLWCPTSGLRATGKELGIYERALPGGGSMATEDEVYLGTQGLHGSPPKDAVVVSLRPGTKVKPTFTYRPVENPTWLRDESFELELPSGATDLSQRRFQGGEWPKTLSRGPSGTKLCDEIEQNEKTQRDTEREEREAAQREADAKGVDDVTGLAPPLDDAGWDAAKSALVTGSDALGCTTKVAPDWFFMRCGGKVEVRGIEVEKGRRHTQTKATFADGVATLLTPYVEGTDSVALSLSLGGFGCSAKVEAKVAPPEPPPPETKPEPKPEPAAKPAKEGHVTITDDHLEIDDVIQFDTSKATIKPESNELLDDIVKVLKGHQEIAVLHVIGHTDARGDKEQNRKLSDERAKAVVDYLKSKGVTQSIDARGAGPDEPLCTEDSDPCHTKNRRVEFKIEKKK
jgi:outer membrane protein OmpA-like peptidoglycan-associated protein